VTYTILPSTDGVTPYDSARDQYIQQGIADAHTLAASASYPDLVAELYATSGFTIGHRLGGGDEAPEHTEIGSQQALGKGQRAVEMSAQATADGVMIAMHDSTLDRTTSASGNVADFSLAQLTSSPIVDIGTTALGAGWSAAQRIPLVGNELRRWENHGVVFLEPKSDATRTLQAATAFADPGNWIVW
jgi:glycerophosphoryl diester phosphodiesterase